MRRALGCIKVGPNSTWTRESAPLFRNHVFLLSFLNRLFRVGDIPHTISKDQIILEVIQEWQRPVAIIGLERHGLNWPARERDMHNKMY